MVIHKPLLWVALGIFATWFFFTYIYPRSSFLAEHTAPQKGIYAAERGVYDAAQLRHREAEERAVSQIKQGDYEGAQRTLDRARAEEKKAQNITGINTSSVVVQQSAPVPSDQNWKLPEARQPAVQKIGGNTWRVLVDPRVADYPTGIKIKPSESVEFAAEGLIQMYPGPKPGPGSGLFGPQGTPWTVLDPTVEQQSAYPALYSANSQKFPLHPGELLGKLGHDGAYFSIGIRQEMHGDPTATSGGEGDELYLIVNFAKNWLGAIHGNFTLTVNVH